MQERELRDQIVIAALIGISLLVLMVGSVGADSRLVVSGVSLSPFLFLIPGFLVVAVPQIRQEVPFVLAWLSLIAPLALTLFWSSRPDYGGSKIFNSLATVLVVAPVFLVCIRSLGTEGVCRILVLLLSLLLVAAILYKLRYGFWNRQVLFFMNGPIVFARLMGIAAVMSLFVLSGTKRMVAFLFFGLAVLWTASKGPILALALTTIACVVVWMPKGERIRFVTWMAMIVAVVVVVGWERIASIDWGRLTSLLGLLTGQTFTSSADFESSGIRLLLYRHSIDVIADHPFGVGLGAWSGAIQESYGLDYAHNLLLELWSEGGILLGSLALIPYFLFVGSRNFILKAVALFLALTQMVSGDLLDARYLLVFSILAVGTRDFSIAPPSKVTK